MLFARSTFAVSLMFVAALDPLATVGTAWSDDVLPLPVEKQLRVIGVGSCCHQDKPMPIWSAVGQAKPDLFLYIGDNIYGDSSDMAVLEAKYAKLFATPSFKQFRQTCPIWAVWDDHDYGINDGGAEFAKRAESQAVFLKTFSEPADSPRRQREGLYDARMFGPEDARVQIILLDTRYFRGPLKRVKRERIQGSRLAGAYVPNTDTTSTMLGETQWNWLEEQLRQPATIRVIASSIQVLPEDHGFEKWANLPLERDRLFALIKKTNATGVLFVSGDRHMAEISRQEVDTVGYPLYDLTSSSLNSAFGYSNDHNRHRLGAPYHETNFGTLQIDWQGDDTVIQLRIHDERGKVVVREDVPLRSLRPRQ